MRYLMWLWAILIVVQAILWATIAATARDADGRYANSPLHDWYAEQRNSAGQWCCNEADGHLFYGDYRINEDGSVVVNPGTPDEHKIESYKVLKKENKAGAPVWWYTENAYGKTTYCFIPGSLT